jgi:Outer membrane protein W
VTVLGAVVHTCSRFDENVPYLSELGNINLRRRITVQPVGHSPARHRASTQHPPEERFAVALAPLLHQHVKFGAMLVDRMPQQKGSSRSVTNISFRCQVPGLRRAHDSSLHQHERALSPSWNPTFEVGINLALGKYPGINASVTYIPISTPLTIDALNAMDMHGVTKLHIHTNPLITHLDLVYTSKDGYWLRSKGGWLGRR